MEGCRPATAEDVDRLAELGRHAIAELRPMRGGELFAARETRSEPLEDSFRADIDDPDHSVWLGTIDGVPVGYAVAHVEPLRNGELLGVIEDLFVEEGAREVAVGEALMDSVMAWFSRRGCSAADAFALPGNRETKNFFESHGFSARLLVMHHRMP